MSIPKVPPSSLARSLGECYERIVGRARDKKQEDGAQQAGRRPDLARLRNELLKAAAIPESTEQLRRLVGEIEGGHAYESWELAEIGREIERRSYSPSDE